VTVDGRGRRLTFVGTGNGFVDGQAGTRGTILGRATTGPLAGRQVAAYPFVDTFWFTWVAFGSGARLIG
jgi:hypothetical protein